MKTKIQRRRFTVTMPDEVINRLTRLARTIPHFGVTYDPNGDPIATSRNVARRAKLVIHILDEASRAIEEAFLNAVPDTNLEEGPFFRLEVVVGKIARTRQAMYQEHEENEVARQIDALLARITAQTDLEGGRHE